MPHDPTILDAINRNSAEDLERCLQSIEPNSPQMNVVNDKQETYLHAAVEEILKKSGYRSWQVLELLLAHGVDPDIRNNQRKTALESVELNVKNDKESSSPLLRAIHQSLPRLLAAMIKAGANIFVGYSLSLQDPNPLHIAMSLQLEALNNRNIELFDRCKQCATILLQNHAGFGINFISKREAAKIINFADIIILGAIVDAQLVKDNVSFSQSCVSIKQLEKYIQKKYAAEVDALPELQKIKLSCECVIQESRKNIELKQRMERLLNLLIRKWPALNANPQAVDNYSQGMSNTPPTLFHPATHLLNPSDSVLSREQTALSTPTIPLIPPSPIAASNTAAVATKEQQNAPTSTTSSTKIETTIHDDSLPIQLKRAP